MRNVDTIDRELRLLAIIRASLRGVGGSGGTGAAVDRLLDERLEHAAGQ